MEDSRRLVFAVALVTVIGGCGAAATPASPSSEPIVSASPLVSPAAPTPDVTYAAPPWRPGANELFQIQLSGPLDLSVDASIYELDGEETPITAIDALRSKWGGHFFCYIDAGTWENYRSDAGAFPASVMGWVPADWPDERWLDIRQIDMLAPILRARMDVCKAKGFDGVDFDNVDGYANPTGFTLTGPDQLRFNRWLAAEAHQRGLLVLLKNDGEQAADLVADFDGAVVEQCVEFQECGLYKPFVDAGKAVLDIEYNVPQKDFCAARVVFGIDTILKHESLDAYRLGCPG
jgi:hypothetical protein